MLFILSGKATCYHSGKIYPLSEDGLLLINPYTLYDLVSTNATYLAFDLDIDGISSQAEALEPLRYHLFHDGVSTPSSIVIKIKEQLANLLQELTTNTDNNPHLLLSIVHTLLHHLDHDFIDSTLDNHWALAQHQLNRFQQIASFIKINYRENLTLVSLAEEFYLTPQYLSKLFKDILKIGFKEYLTDIRLDNSLEALIKSPLTLDQLSSEAGFVSARSYSTAFNKRYGVLPSAYRKSHKYESLTHTISGTKDVLLSQQDFKTLAKYLAPSNLTVSAAILPRKVQRLQSVSMADDGLCFDKFYLYSTTIGSASQILLSSNQNMLRQLQKDIGFKYIKFHGLLDDAMMFYSEDDLGEVHLNYNFIDQVLDFLLSIGLRPFLELSFMPKDLAEDPSHTMFYHPSIISFPKSLNKWITMIQSLLDHLISRYGRDELSNWHFYLWNQPDSPSSLFGFREQERFFDWYQCTYRIFKNCNETLSFGTPSLMTGTLPDSPWFTAFMVYCEKYDCRPDFINYHYYPIHSNQHLSPEAILTETIGLNPEPNAFKLHMKAIKAAFSSTPYQSLPIYITEFNSTISQRDYLNDTAFKAAYVVKNILDGLHNVQAMGYWTLSDLSTETKLSDDLFHGGLGLMTYNGIPKPSYYALKFLSRLGDYIVHKQEGYIVTKSKKQWTILLYNYHHFNESYGRGELFSLSATERTGAFTKLEEKKMVLNLKESEYDTYVITDTIINEESGSAYNTWLRVGALPMNTPEELDYILSSSKPRYEKNILRMVDNQLHIERTLAPHEVRLITINPDL